MSDTPTPERVPVCEIGGSIFYGTQEEADACQLPDGARVVVTRRNGDIIHGTLKRIWCFSGDGPMYDVKTDFGGKGMFSFSLGDVIRKDKAMTDTCAERAAREWYLPAKVSRAAEHRLAAHFAAAYRPLLEQVRDDLKLVLANGSITSLRAAIAAIGVELAAGKEQDDDNP